ncbi:MAG TPA: FAD-dependent oxidoreductase [Patescibacteria group bacterium]|nr:FAD-dependent oxidoreductase [Patescibacteria group bacterium]
MKLKLVSKRQEILDVTTFIFEPQEKIKWIAGQYLHWVLHHEPTDDRGSDRWFTISSAPFEKEIHITTRFNKERSSSFKNKLFSLEIGKSIENSYLEGDFIVTDPNKKYIFLAGGIGITPFRSIIKQLDHDKLPINVDLLYANHDQNIVFKKELEEISKRNPNFKITYIFSPEHIDENKIKQIVSFQNKIIYVSGPELMVEDLIKMLKEIGIKEENIKGDWFPNYPKF